MKSKHLARADYLRELAKLAKQLFELGDFTSDDPERAKLSAKIEGYAMAGTTIEVVTSSEIQSVIDKAHLEKFGEARDVRRSRILEERAKKTSESEIDDGVDWDLYDSPAKDRKK
jgi:hypothetical protein